ncbi:hypothetical protein Mycsm_02832 [Mycobacterium sp. JS623]|uniref:hypothetical protein n=1 Tax=Mycobacterium sp. JS623 TaxID=212767 RepID=UPI0002A5B08A|nr:hypothetical protein [Mycobacterium sp. JS623]AGB23158.1 hypothetical protein Mycsm_02832 [Mycobacterium sp. JS623]
MSNSVDIVHAFWEQCWNARDPAAVDTAVWAVREDGKLLSNHVERAALDQFQRLTRST